MGLGGAVASRSSSVELEHAKSGKAGKKKNFRIANKR